MSVRMNTFLKYCIFLQLSVQFLTVVCYTVVLKQVKTLHPAVKVYRYDLRHAKILPEGNTQYVYHKPFPSQKIYPVPFKPGRDAHFKPRGPVKKEKGKFSKGVEPPLRDPRLAGLSQHLVPPVSNQIEEYSEAKEEEDEVRPLATAPNLGKSYSSFGQEKGKIYNHAGEWAVPAPQADGENGTKSEFTPSQLYLQIRHKNTVIHVPQSEALKDAETLEELINAPRLKELARTTHVQETYSEEGYEDAGYDHAGHIRQAQHGEVYDAKDEGKFKIKDPPVIIDYDSDLEESKKVSSKNLSENEPTGENLSNKLEPRITRSRAEVSKKSVEYTETPKNYKGEHLYSSRVKSPRVSDSKGFDEGENATATKVFPIVEATFPSYFGEMPPTPEGALSNTSSLYYKPSHKKSSKYRKAELNSTRIHPVTESTVGSYADFKPYISQIDSQASPSTKSLKYSKIYSKKTKQLRLEPYKNENIFSPPPPPSESPLHEDLQPPAEEAPINQRIVLPTIGYINSLTTAYFGKDGSKQAQEEPKPELTDALNLTQALNYLRSNRNQKNQEPTKSPTELDIRTFEPMKLKKTSVRGFVNKSKRDVYLMRTRERRSEEEYEGNDESDAPHNEKNEEIAEDERKRIEDENQEKEKYEADLREEISNQEKEILKETYKNIGVEEDISEVFPEFSSSDSESSYSSIPEETNPTPVDVKKYPFYLSKRLPENSALRYATDPRQFPRKSGYKMEFYDSRERLIQCPDFHPDLGDLPNSNSTEYSDEQAGDSQRLTGVGDKIACLRMKYFDAEPFDNPIFKEREIDYVGKHKRPSSKTVHKEISRGTDKNWKENRQRAYSSQNNLQKSASHIQNQITSQETSKTPVNLHNIPASTSNKTEASRIIPVTEIISDDPQPANSYSKPFFWKTTYSSQPPRPSPAPFHPKTHSKTPELIIIPHSCLNNLSKLSLLDGSRSLTVECQDAVLIQEVSKDKARLRIIPKEAIEKKKQIKRKWSPPAVFDDGDWIPIVGHSVPTNGRKLQKPLSRRTDEVTKLKNETSHNISSNHYVIDELKEEENVRKGEVVDDMDHYMKMMESKPEEPEVTTVKTETVKSENTTETSRRKRRAEGNSEGGESRKLKLKRPLTRLSGIDFLVKYHKNKNKHVNEKPEDFWKVGNRPQRKSGGTEKPINPVMNTSEVKSVTEVTTKKTESKQNTQQPNTSAEKISKLKVKQSEPRKIQPLNVVPEKITKPEFKPADLSKPTESTRRIITRVSKEVSESTEKPKIVYKKVTTTQIPETEAKSEASSAKSEVPQYKTIDRKSKESKRLSKPTDNSDGPILYYIVNLKTGRGKWVTNYDERRRGGYSKYHQSQKQKRKIGGKERKKNEK